MIHSLMNGEAEALDSKPLGPDIKEGGHEVDVFSNEVVIKPIALCRINTMAGERSFFTVPNPMNIYIHKRNLFPEQAEYPGFFSFHF